MFLLANHSLLAISLIRRWAAWYSLLLAAITTFVVCANAAPQQQQ
jgi:hypothetical protein